MSLYVVRHGQTDWNVNNILQGTSDIPLNKTGIEQAKILSQNLENISISSIISSPLSRALDTANIINEKKKVPLSINSAISERSFGKLEGIYGYDYDKYAFWDYKKNLHYEDVEPVQDFFKRIHQFLDEYKTLYLNENVLIVTHNGVNIAINCYFHGLPENFDLLNLSLGNCSYIKYDLID